VRSFLDEKHSIRYRIFNLCQEKKYDAFKFGGRVRWIPIPDHQPPSLRQIMQFCNRSVLSFLMLGVHSIATRRWNLRAHVID
jgi:phosphatidylinositol-3,4,5-trisphosphate 3-phosphatase/dual-specificity protein phosphatase PTEN